MTTPASLSTMKDKRESSSAQLVQLNRAKPEPATRSEQLLAGPVVDKFFALGALFGVIGTAGYGAYLWLALNNILPISYSYLELRRTHAVVQIYLFFGMFVLGFLSQAGGKMLGIKARLGKRALFVLPVYVVGSFGILAGASWGAIVVSGCFIAFALYIAGTALKQRGRLPQTVLSIIGLSVLAWSPYSSLESPLTGLILLWGGFGAMIFAASNQFISAFLGGRSLSGIGGYLFLATYLLSLCVLLPDPRKNAELGAALAVSATLLYLITTRASTWLKHFYPHPLGLAFISAYAWLVIAWCLQLTQGTGFYDFTVHLLAVGWAGTLILAVSHQVVSFVTGSSGLLPQKLWWGLLLIWQLVPAGRGLLHVLQLPAWFSLIVAVSGSAVLLCWAGAICKAEWKMLKFQASLNRGEVVKSCGS